MSWTTDEFVGKARLYVERGLEAEEPAEKAWWFHFAIEPMIRAMISTLHPVILADPRSVESLLAAVGETEADSAVIRTRGLAEITEYSTRFASVTVEVKDAAVRLIVRRNAECHGPTAEFENLGEERWMPDFLMLAAAFCKQCGLELKSFVGNGYAEQAEELEKQTVAEAEAEVAKLIAEAKKRPVEEVEASTITMIEKTSGEVQWAVDCPACGKRGKMAGMRVHVGAARFDGDELSQPVSIAGRSFACPYCGLKLQGTAQLVAAELPVATTTYDYVDPFEALQIDVVEEANNQGLHVIDPHEGPEYEDE
jgi:hypothetical protein